jgi:hypothetical protein
MVWCPANFKWAATTINKGLRLARSVWGPAYRIGGVGTLVRTAIQACLAPPPSLNSMQCTERNLRPNGTSADF